MKSLSCLAVLAFIGAPAYAQGAVIVHHDASPSGSAAPSVRHDAGAAIRLMRSDFSVAAPGAFASGTHGYFVHNTPPHGQYYWRHGRRHLAL